VSNARIAERPRWRGRSGRARHVAWLRRQRQSGAGGQLWRLV